MKTGNRILATAGSLFLAMILAAGIYKIISPRPVNASTVEVKIDNFSFAPTTLVVRKGTQITWTNRDDIPHTVVQIQSARYRREVHLHAHKARHLQIFLFDSPENDGRDRS
jgi:plastocyanin